MLCTVYVVQTVIKLLYILFSIYFITETTSNRSFGDLPSLRFIGRLHEIDGVNKTCKNQLHLFLSSVLLPLFSDLWRLKPDNGVL